MSAPALTIRIARNAVKRIVLVATNQIAIAKVWWSPRRPLISVVIPCFNYGQYVEETIASLRQQTFKDFEIIVVEGGSTDQKTRRVVTRLRGSRLRKVFQQSPHMVGANRNHGIARAQGKYIVCLDADDLLDPTYLEKAVFIAEAGGYDLVHASVQHFGDSDAVWRSKEASFRTCAEFNEVATTALFTKKMWNRAGGFKDFGLGDKHVPEDWDFWIRLLGHGAAPKAIQEPLMLYRMHSSGLFSKASMSIERQREEIRSASPQLFARKDQSPPVRQRSETPSLSALLRYAARHKDSIFVVLPETFEERVVQAALNRIQTRAKKRTVVILSQYDWDVEATVFVSLAANIRRVTPEWFNLPTFLEESLWSPFCEYLVQARRPSVLVEFGSSKMNDFLLRAFEKHASGATRTSDLLTL